MADDVATKVLYEDDRIYIASFTNTSDGTGESAVKKVDVSALSPAASTVAIEEVWFTTSGMGVKVIYDATTDDVMLLLNGTGHMKFNDFGGIRDPKSSGFVGDVLFTTVGHTSGDTYTVILKCRKY